MLSMCLRGMKTYGILVEQKLLGHSQGMQVILMGQVSLDENNVIMNHEWFAKFSFTRIILPTLDAQIIFICIV